MVSETPRTEITKTPENIVISPENLFADNQSEKAKKLSLAWEENRRQGNLWGIVTCGDARIMTPCPERLISVRSIATAGTKEVKIFSNKGLKIVVVMSHVDGDTIETGKRPKGCGGLGAKEEALNGNHEKPIAGIQYYIDEKIEHPDPVIQAFISAREIRNTTGKPSLAVIQNHRTGKVYPFAVFFKDYQTVSKNLDGIDLKEYSPAKIYAEGLPILPDEAIPDMFKEFLDANTQQVNEILRKYPNLKDMQKVQNPRLVVISSKLPSIRIRYPETTDVPGLVFKLFLSREKEGPGKISISANALRETIGQAQYPLEHAAHNFGQPDKPFSRTDRVLVETSDINVSRNLAVELAEKPWMKEWLELPDHRLLVAQNIEGISNIIEYFVPPKA